MEAELLTGKDLNLETARRAALNGDIETVAKEINRQIGTSADFSKMNVIQQEALAKAMGTSREELSDMLVQQESLNKLKGTFNALSDEQLKLLKDKGKIDQLTYERLKNGTASAGEYYDSLKRAGLTTEELTSKLGDASLKALESQSAQDKFNDTLEKVKESFSRAFTGETIDKFADTLADFVKRWSEDGLFSAIFNSGGTPPTPEEKMASSGVSQSEIKQIKNDEVVTAPRGPKFANGGVITKPVYNATIGEAGPEAVIPLGELMKHFNAMNNTLNAILQKDSNIYLDGTKVGTAMNVSTRRVQ
jgi:hypothetical protein